MSQRIAFALVGLAAVLALGAAPASSAEPQAPKSDAPPAGASKADLPCPRGWQMMTPEEIQQHWAQMQAAKTPAEREQIRQQHHAQMVERARERGVTLPDQPGGPCPGWPGKYGQGMGGPGMGRGMGPGSGMGRGMGPAGAGMGPGPGTGTGGGTAPQPKQP